MFRAQPVGSRLCAQKWQEDQYKRHRQKLAQVKPSVDNRSPPRFRHLEVNLKRAQTEEERFAAIEKDNRRLLSRMTTILSASTGDGAVGDEVVAASRSASPVRLVADHKGPRSLNREYRRRQLEKITQENHAILKRIQDRRPFYNHGKWEEDFRKNEEMAQRIAQKPFVLVTFGDRQRESASRAKSVSRLEDRNTRPTRGADTAPGPEQGGDLAEPARTVPSPTQPASAASGAGSGSSNTVDSSDATAPQAQTQAQTPADNRADGQESPLHGAANDGGAGADAVADAPLSDGSAPADGVAVGQWSEPPALAAPSPSHSSPTAAGGTAAASSPTAAGTSPTAASHGQTVA